MNDTQLAAAVRGVFERHGIIYKPRSHGKILELTEHSDSCFAALHEIAALVFDEVPAQRSRAAPKLSTVLTLADVKSAAARYFRVSVTELEDAKRNRTRVAQRAITLYVCKQFFPLVTYRELGEAFGGRDHSTVRDAIERVKAAVDVHDTVTTVHVLGVEQQIVRLKQA